MTLRAVCLFCWLVARGRGDCLRRGRKTLPSVPLHPLKASPAREMVENTTLKPEDGGDEGEKALDAAADEFAADAAAAEDAPAPLGPAGEGEISHPFLGTFFTSTTTRFGVSSPRTPQQAITALVRRTHAMPPACLPVRSATSAKRTYHPTPPPTLINSSKRHTHLPVCRDGKISHPCRPRLR
jgi:hypothetical protein